MKKLLRRMFARGGTEPLDPRLFQALVFDVVERRFPGEAWALTEDPAVIRCGADWLFGLQNLYAGTGAGISAATNSRKRSPTISRRT